MFQHELAGLLEQHIDDGPLRRSEDHVLDELLVLDAAAVAADELHPGPGQRDLEHARVGGVGQVDAHHLAPLGGQPELRLAGDQQRVAEAAHRRVVGLQAAERRDLAVFEQHVVERDAQLPVRRPPVVGVRGLDDHVAVEAHLLGVVLADVRVVPVDAGIRERHATGEAAADGDRRLGLVRAVGAVVQAQAVPVHRLLQVAVVDDVDLDLRALADLQRRPGNRAVVGQHPHGGVAEPLAHRRDPQLKALTLGQLDKLGRSGGRQAAGVAWELVGGCAHLPLLESVTGDFGKRARSGRRPRRRPYAGRLCQRNRR